MSYLEPSEFVTKMVDSGESKIYMSTKDTTTLGVRLEFSSNYFSSLFPYKSKQIAECLLLVRCVTIDSHLTCQFFSELTSSYIRLGTDY